MRVLLATGAQRSFERLPTLVKARLVAVFRRLEKWPSVSGARPPRGRLWGTYRIRTGDYRVQFRVESEAIVIVKMGHREGFYDE